jgi:acetolactate synthase-1/2/3 large subunit
MDAMEKMAPAAQRLVEVLLVEGVSHVFCVPGESYLAVLDALADVQDRIQVICCRHEAAAANMAAAYGKLTGRPGICMVTRGPGATQASVGIHTAQQDSAPMIMFVGQVARAYRGREAFQEVDYVSFFHSMTKWVAEIDQSQRMTELVSRAFSTALHGRQGPVVLSIPEDMLTEQVPAGYAAKGHTLPLALAPAVADQIVLRLQAARRPLLILGGSGWTPAALSGLSAWCEDNALPVVLGFRRKDLLDNDHPCYAGDLGVGANPSLVERVREADLVLAIGSRLSEIVSQGYKLFSRAETAEKLIHIHPDANEVGRVWPCAIGAAADVSSAALALSQARLGPHDWRGWARACHDDYEKFSAPLDTTGAVNLSEIFHHLQEVMPDAIICNGAGNYAAWLHRFYRHRKPFTQLGPTSGAMGFGVPAAIAAKLAKPECEAVAVAGDGCFMMAGQELATAVQYGANILVLIVDNGSLGTIRMHQEREYPNRPLATDLRNPDFVAYAKSFGAWAKIVETTAAFPDALREARAHQGVAVLHLKTSLKDIAPGRVLAGA